MLFRRICWRTNSSGTRREPSPTPVPSTKASLNRRAAGTVFLDEIGEMSLAAQVRLLRVLRAARGGPHRRQAHRSRWTFASSPRPIAIYKRRLTSASSVSTYTTGSRSSSSTFRRCAAEPKTSPLLIEYFISELTQDNKSRLEGFSGAALDLLQNYAWPGNVREVAQPNRALGVPRPACPRTNPKTYCPISGSSPRAICPCQPTRRRTNPSAS